MKKWIRKLTAGLCAAVLAAGASLGQPSVTLYAKEEVGPGIPKTEQQSGGAEENGRQGGDGGSGLDGGEGEGGAQPELPADLPQIKINYRAFFRGVGWSPAYDDNTACSAPGGSYVTALAAYLLDQPEGMTGTIAYQVNLSGSGWLEYGENGAETGATETDMPLEAVRMRLTGQLGEFYDVYYSVLQNGEWTGWLSNEQTAGTEGAGLRIDGIRISVARKGEGEPEIKPEPQPPQGIDPSRPMVALTFDDGPRASVTNRILDSLEANGGRATFFMVGNRVPGNKACVKRMTDLGCQLGNHTYEHKYLTQIGEAGIRSQVALTNQKIAEAGGAIPIVLRPPGGFYDRASLNTLASMGLPAIMWSIDTRDWKTRNAQNTINVVLSQVKDGDIVLMHDIYDTSAEAAAVIIPELVGRGYQLVTVSELARHRGGLTPGRVYNSFRP